MLHIIDQLGMAAAPGERAEIDATLRRVMSYRNAFTHGILIEENGAVRLQYFEGRQQTGPARLKPLRGSSISECNFI